jgi:hypothetical protein
LGETVIVIVIGGVSLVVFTKLLIVDWAEILAAIPPAAVCNGLVVGFV